MPRFQHILRPTADILRTRFFPKLTLFTDAFYSAFCSSQKHFPQLFIPLTLKGLHARGKTGSISILQMRKPRLGAEKDTSSRAHSQEAAHSAGFTQECVSKWMPVHCPPYPPARQRVWGTITMEGERGIPARAPELEGTSRRAAQLSLCFTAEETEAQRDSMVGSKSWLVSERAGPPPAL